VTLRFSVPDICDKHSDVIQIGNIEFQSYGKKKSFHGQIETLFCPDDNSLVKKALNTDGKNKVLVIDASSNTHTSMVGDQIAAAAKKNNWAGIIVNGNIRDIEVIANIEIGVLAKASVPLKTNKDDFGKQGVNLYFNNVIIKPGFWIYVDTNGWVVSKNKLEF
jgi:regulator of ribonuclease activity A